MLITMNMVMMMKFITIHMIPADRLPMICFSGIAGTITPPVFIIIMINISNSSLVVI